MTESGDKVTCLLVPVTESFKERLWHTIVYIIWSFMSASFFGTSHSCTEDITVHTYQLKLNVVLQFYGSTFTKYFKRKKVLNQGICESSTSLKKYNNVQQNWTFNPKLIIIIIIIIIMIITIIIIMLHLMKMTAPYKHRGLIKPRKLYLHLTPFSEH